MRKPAGIAGKLTLGVVTFGILMGAVCCTVGYIEFTAVLEQQYNDSAYEIAEMARAFLNPDQFHRYLATGETDQEYEEILRTLDMLTDMADVTFIYVAEVDPSDYKTITYIYDAVHSGTGLERHSLGYTAADLDEKHKSDVIKIMTEGGRATEYLYSYSKESGAYTTAAMDVRDSKGEIVAMICVEKSMSRLENTRRAYVLFIILWSLGAMILFSAAYAIVLRHNVIKPILTVVTEANRFANDHTSSDALLAIQQKDEIGILAQTINKMEKGIVEYTDNLIAITAEKERVRTEFSIAASIQANILPSIFPAFPEREEFGIYAATSPAKEGGGDFYDFFMVDERHLAIVVANVSGKGVLAALFMVISKTLMKDHTQPEKDLGCVFAEVNDLLCQSNSAGLSLAAFEGVLDLVSGEFHFVSAGYESIYICKKEGKFEPYPIHPGFVLAGMEGRRYKCGSIQLEVGDKIFQCTAGVTKAANKDKELYGIERLTEILGKYSKLAPAELLPKAKADIDRFVGDALQLDDITMLCFEYKARMKE